MTPMAETGRANGKLLLFGEHAAVYGHPAVGVTLVDETTATFGGCPASAWNLATIPTEDVEGVRRVLDRMERVLPGFAAAGRCEVRIRSGVQPMAGFGSSAALCGALARAALWRTGENGGDLGRAWTIAHEAERIFHGTPSGVDTGLSLLKGTCILRPRPSSLPGFEVVPTAGIRLVFGAVRRDGLCRDLVAGLAAKMRSGDRAVKTAIASLGEIAESAAALLRAGGDDRASGLGTLANDAMDRLRSLGLGTRDLEVVLDASRDAGATGAKLSGAGGGGAFYAVAPDAATADAIASRIERDAAATGVALIAPVRIVVA